MIKKKKVFDKFCFIRNLAFGTLHIITSRTLFLVISILMRVIVSVGEASILPSAIAIGSKSLSDKYESLAMSTIDTCYTIGLMLGPSLGGALYHVAGLYLPFLVAGALALCLSVASLKARNDSTQSDAADSSSCSRISAVLRVTPILVSMLGKERLSLTKASKDI